ncbi:MAG: nicotinate-nucleotide--dimethylbenzimidazole phosphoribosyltransferase [Candidatus Omnitrophota bacterium]
MDKLDKIISKIKPLDHRLAEKAQERLDNLTKPQGSLGRLEELAKKIVAITGKQSPLLKHKVIFTLAADHGVVEEGVSAFPQAVTAQMIENFLSGGAGINVLAAHVGARIVVVDMGVAGKPKAKSLKRKSFKDKRIAWGTKNMAIGPAMTKQEAMESLEKGIEAFAEEWPRGIDIIGTGDMGIGNTTAAAAIAACFTRQPVEAVTGRGTGIDDRTLAIKIEAIKRALKVNRPDPNDALDVLSKVGGFEIGGLAGIILAAAAARVPVVVDGFISGAAALIAYKLEPQVKDYLIAAHCSVEKGHKLILDYLGLKPLLNLNLRLGEGTGAALGISLAEAGVKIMTQMATFKSAGVSQRSS